MKKVTILLGVMLIGLTLFGQKEYDKYPNIDSLKPILRNTLIEFFMNDDMSFLDSDIKVKDDLLYTDYNSTTGKYVYLDTLNSKDYIKDILDPNLSAFIGHPDYEFEILENGVNGFYNAQSKWVIIVMLDSQKHDKQLVIEFNFNYIDNKLQYISIFG